MSCTWDIICMDCNEEADFYEVYRVDIVRSIILKSDAIAEFRAKINDSATTLYDLEVRCDNHDLPLEFFLKHRGHRLLPVNEYGDLDLPCPLQFSCQLCDGKAVQCERLRPAPGMEHRHRCGHRTAIPGHGEWHSAAEKKETS